MTPTQQALALDALQSIVEQHDGYCEHHIGATTLSFALAHTASDALAAIASLEAAPAAPSMFPPQVPNEHGHMLTSQALWRMYAEDAAPAAVAEPVEPPMTLTKAANDVLAERRRQTEAEGWTPEHDDEHVRGEIAQAAACYALFDAAPSPVWPSQWDISWWKPKDQRRNLVRAAALLLAEIERLDRAAGRASRWAAAEPWIA